MDTFGALRRNRAGTAHGGLSFTASRDSSALLPGQGFMVIEVHRGSPAALAGIRGMSGQVQYRLGNLSCRRRHPVAFQGKEISSPVEVATAIDHLKSRG
jgi:S1-C subfamily serine protease